MIEQTQSTTKDRPYSIYYRTNRLFRMKNQWFFEDDAGKPFGPFDDKTQTIRAVRIYRDIKEKGIPLEFDRIQRIM